MIVQLVSIVRIVVSGVERRERREVGDGTLNVVVVVGHSQGYEMRELLL